MTPPDILRLDNITKRYSSQLPPAVDRVSLALQQGEILGLLGPSGCGKTTLLRLIAGFEQPDDGDVFLGSQSVCGTTWLPPERRDVGIVFQDYALFPHLTVAQNVAFGLQGNSRGGPTATEIEQQTAAAISLVGLEGLKHRFPHELSGGQQQRVALARALAPRPTIILLDEPFSNLDVQVRLYLRQEVRDILRQVGASGVFVTHDQEEALALADRVAVMHQGRLEQIDAPEAVYGQPSSRFVAEFVTQANFLPAQHSAGGWLTEVGCFKAKTDATDQPGSQLGQVDLMVRQEDIALVEDAVGGAVVRDRQFLGREYKYCLQTPAGKWLYARLPVGNPIAIGSRVTITVPSQQVRLYPRQSGDARLEPVGSTGSPPATAML
ncbi:ABC transporter ATP-binding protein [Nodosilinea sp. LEGE 07088]|uniref:ABC transporter ATP-binding protein n=1 Tax=Nodosilinea sp. LEGE 07088 TaxID=2777968 RepID=UPI001881DA97|nr:ABC transporter ATP-binding protein [Nodosilinea sp. LEGE 07088]MBE9136844.1 ABC transporter ATP-binding protein [Nodosilinea sp. LEGE 07088]